MKKMKRGVLLLSLVVMLVFVTASDFIEAPNRYSFNLYKEYPVIEVNISVNSSSYWDTADRGPLRNVQEIMGSWITNDLGWITLADAQGIHDQDLNTTDDVQFNSLKLVDTGRALWLTNPNSNIEAAGNITVGEYFIGNGSQLTGLVGPVQNITGVYYVEAGNAADIQAKIDACSVQSCTVIIPSGVYSLSEQVDISSSINLVNYGIVQWDLNANPENHTDSQGSKFNFLFFGEEVYNFTFNNYGTLSPRRIYDTSVIEEAMGIFNGSNIFIQKGGLISHCNSGYKLIDVSNSTVQDIVAQDSGGVNTECGYAINILNINGYGINEAVDLNYGDDFISVQNVYWNQLENTQETIDVNRGTNVLVSNVNSLKSTYAVNFNDNAGTYDPRWGSCIASDTRYNRNNSASGIRCTQCTNQKLGNDNIASTEVFNDNHIIWTLPDTPPSSTNYFRYNLEDGGSTSNADYLIYASSDLIYRVRSRSDGDSTSLYFADDDDIKFHVQEDGDTQVGSSTNPANFKLYSPDGTEYTCGVANGGTFSCS